MGSTCETCSASDAISDMDTNTAKRVRSVSAMSESIKNNGSIEHITNDIDDKSVSASTAEHIRYSPSESKPSSDEVALPQFETIDDGAENQSNHEANEILMGHIGFLEKDNDSIEYDTTRLATISSDLYKEMHTFHQLQNEQLVSLNAWLERKQSSIPYGWLRRWVVLKNGYILWSEWEQSVQNDIDSKEMNRWNKCIYLGDKDILISEAESKKKRKFKINTTEREFIFKTKDEKQRDIWMNGVKEHIQYTQQNSNAFFINN